VLPLADAAEHDGVHAQTDDWLERADAAEARDAWQEAAYYLERWAAQQPDEIGEEFWMRRLRLAESAGDAAERAHARTQLLTLHPEDDALRFALADDLAAAGSADEAAALLALDFADPGVQVRAWRRAAAFYEQDQRFAAAAALLERAAAHPLAGAAAAAWWERASWLWERAGDRAAATRAIERALQDIALGPRESAALGRLRAFELGAIGTVADAEAVLRFHEDPELRWSAARYLADADFDAAIAVFAHALSDPDPRILRLCLQQLARRVAPQEKAFVARQVLPFLQHNDADLRALALDALAVSAERAQVPILLDALDPADRPQFRAARRALETVTGRAEPAPLDPDLAGREALRAAWRAWWNAQGGT
jgi:tetratricopeptide (TPR) repeat protein